MSRTGTAAQVGVLELTLDAIVAVTMVGAMTPEERIAKIREYAQDGRQAAAGLKDVRAEEAREAHAVLYVAADRAATALAHRVADNADNHGGRALRQLRIALAGYEASLRAGRSA